MGHTVQYDPTTDIRISILKLIESLVDHPGEVEVTINKGGMTVIFEVTCNQLDIGKLVGKRGSMAEALRVVVKSLGAKHGVRAMIEICD